MIEKNELDVPLTSLVESTTQKPEYKLTDGDIDILMSMAPNELRAVAEGANVGASLSKFIKSSIEGAALDGDPKYFNDDFDVFSITADELHELNIKNGLLKWQVMSIIQSRDTILDKIRATERLISRREFKNYLIVMSSKELESELNKPVLNNYVVYNRFDLERLFSHLDRVCQSFSKHAGVELARIVDDKSIEILHTRDGLDEIVGYKMLNANEILVDVMADLGDVYPNWER